MIENDIIVGRESILACEATTFDIAGDVVERAGAAQTGEQKALVVYTETHSGFSVSKGELLEWRGQTLYQGLF